MDIHIIDNYKELPLGYYQRILDVYKDETLEDIDRQVKVISILTKKSESEILDMPIMDYQKLSSTLGWLGRELPETPTRPFDSYRLGGFELIPVMDMRKVTTAQYIDFQSLHKEGMEEHFVEILSCLLLPKGKKYCEDYDILDVQNAIREELNVYDAVSLYGFFISSCNRSIKDMLISLLQEVKKMTDKEMREKMESQIREQLNLLK